jgi:histidine triad (HIT) family protein
MAYTYDTNNIFARILRSEIPCKKVLETEHALAFHDIAPQAPMHVMVIPKGPYVNFDHFAREASDAEQLGFNAAIVAVIDALNIAPGAGKMGYRMVANAGDSGMQEVPHLHVHIVSGRPLGRMIPRAD